MSNKDVFMEINKDIKQYERDKARWEMQAFALRLRGLVCAFILFYLTITNDK